MAISFDNATQYVGTGNFSTSPADFSYTMGTGTNGILIVYFYHQESYLNTSSVTFNGVAMTLGGHVSRTEGVAQSHIELWYLVNPPSGTHNIEFTFVTETIFGVIAASYFGVDQTSPFDVVGTRKDANPASDITYTFSTVADNAWQSVFYWVYASHQTFTAVTGSMRAQGNGNVAVDNSMALIDRGPLTPAGSFSTEATTGTSGNLGAFGISLNPGASFIPKVMFF